MKFENYEIAENGNHYLYLREVSDNDAVLLQHLGFEPLDCNKGAVIGEPGLETWVKYASQDQQIQVKVPDGYIITERNSDPDWDGVTVYFKSNAGDVCDIVCIECTAKKNQKQIDVYTYEEVWEEGWTRTYNLKTEEICEAIEG